MAQMIVTLYIYIVLFAACANLAQQQGKNEF